MSIAAITWVFGNRRNEPGLSGPKNAQRLVLLVLANYADEEGEAWPGMDTIAQEANLTRNTTKTALSWLIEHGYLERDVRAGKPRRGSRQARNVYRLRWEAEREGSNSDPSPDDQEGSDSDVERDRNSRERGTEIRATDENTPSPMNPSEPKGEPASSAEAESLTVNQRAKRITDGYWTWATEQTGNPPAIGFHAIRSVVAALLNADHDDRDVKNALVALFRRGQSIAVQPMQAEIQARGRQSARPSIDAQLDELRYGPDGMLAV